VEIKVLNGTLGMDSPRNDAFGLIVVTRGTMSRTGRCMGSADEGYCVQVTAYLPRTSGAARRVLLVERLYAPDQRVPDERRGPGAALYETVPPSDAAVESAAERARARLLAGGPALAGIQLRRVEGGAPGSQHVYRLRGTREELPRDVAVARALQALFGRETGDDIVVERRPSHGQRWDAWRRYAVDPSGSVVRVDR
jgi:hypothetical protein